MGGVAAGAFATCVTNYGVPVSSRGRESVAVQRGDASHESMHASRSYARSGRDRGSEQESGVKRGENPACLCGSARSRWNHGGDTAARENPRLRTSRENPGISRITREGARAASRRACERVARIASTTGNYINQSGSGVPRNYKSLGSRLRDLLPMGARENRLY